MKFNLSFLISAGIISAISAEKHLRVAGGLEDQVEELLERQLRELATAGSTSQSLSFSYAHSSALSDCFDCGSWCEDFAFAATGTISETSGNAYSDAAIFLYAESCCLSIASAYATACAFTKASGKINVTTANTATLKSASLSLTLDTAVATLAFAQSQAAAAAFAGVETYAYTDAAAYCTAVNNLSPYCGGFAESGLATIGKAAAGAKGQAGAIATSGAVTNTKAAVEAVGTGIASVNGLITSLAASWSYTSAAATADAFAAAFTASISESFAEMCAGVYEKNCANPDSRSYGVCNQDPEDACAEAAAAGAGFSGALAAACAEACAESWAESVLYVDISANVDCSTSKPKLTYKCAKAGAFSSCSA